MAEGRNIKDSKGIPAENIVIAEVPMTKIDQLVSRDAADGK